MPGAHTDGIFAIIGEELGFIGCAVVVMLFAIAARTAASASPCARATTSARCLPSASSRWIGFQTLINIGGITRSMPLTGIPLPFLSYGGSALMAMLAGIGILLSVSRYGVDPRTIAKNTRPTDGSETIVGARAQDDDAERWAAASKGAKTPAWPERKGAR